MADILWNFKCSSQFVLSLSIILKIFQWALNSLKSHRNDVFSDLFLNFSYCKIKSDPWDIPFNIPSHIAIDWLVGDRSLAWIFGGISRCELSIQPLLLCSHHLKMILLDQYFGLLWQQFRSMIHFIFYIFLPHILTNLLEFFLKINNHDRSSVFDCNSWCAWNKSWRKGNWVFWSHSSFRIFPNEPLGESNIIFTR